MRADLLKLFRAAVGAVDPYVCVKHHLVFDDPRSQGEKKQLRINDKDITLNHNLYVAAFGKAALGICQARNELFISIKHSSFKVCVVRYMNYATIISSKVSLVFLLAPSSKLKGKTFIYRNILC